MDTNQKNYPNNSNNNNSNNNNNNNGLNNSSAAVLRERKTSYQPNSPNLNSGKEIPKVDFNRSRFDDDGYVNMKQSFYNESFRDQNEVYEQLQEHEKDAVLGVTALYPDGEESDTDSDTSHLDENSFENNDIVNYEEDKKKRLYLKAYKDTYQRIDFILEHINIFLSVVSIGLFILLSYLPNPVSNPTTQAEIDNNEDVRAINHVVVAISAYFCFDFIRNFIFAKDKLKFFKKKNTILDIITIVPILITMIPTIPVTPLGFLRVLRILKAPRLFKLHGATSVLKQLVQLILSIVILIILFASMICEIEKIKFHDSIYYAVVSLSTVGYGDITPKSVLGRMVAILMIMIALAYLPIQTSKLVSVLSATKVWNGEYRPSQKKKFVTVIGNIYESSFTTFLKEFFFNSRIGEMPVIVLSSSDPPKFWDSVLNKIKKRFFFFKGSIGNQIDVERVKLERSKSVFIFSQKSLTGSQDDDNENILRVMSIRSFNPNIPIFAQAMIPRLKRKMIAAGATQVISVQELKMSLLAQSCISPGFITLVMNLLRSDLEKYNDDDEYASGNSYEIFTQPFAPAFFGLTFSQVVQLVYESFGMIVFGVEIQVGDKRRIKVNPKNSFIIREGTFGVLLAKNKLQSKRIKFCGTELIKRKIESLKQTHQRNTEIGILDKDCKLVWEYSSIEKTYQCKLKFVPKTKVKKNDKKTLKKLIMEKKRDILNSDEDLSNENTTTIHKNDSNYSSGDDNFELLKSQGQKLDIHSHQTIKPPLPGNSTSTNTSSFHSVMDIPTAPSNDLSSTRIPKRFWSSHFLDECIVDSVETMDNIQNHIIIAGSNVDCIENFISPLRESHVRRYDPIVILTPKLTEDQWKYIECYPEIYVVEGKGYEFSDLKRAGVYKCSKVVVLTNEANSSELIFNDRETLLAMVCLKEVSKRNTNIFPIYEISEPLNMKFLPGNSNWKQNQPFYHAPSFAAGNVFLSSVFDSLLCQCFFNPHLLSMLSVLVGMNPDNSTKSCTKVFQVPLPEHFYHHRFGYLFESLVESNIICIALFRTHSSNTSCGADYNKKAPVNPVVLGLPQHLEDDISNQTTRYVLTNPTPSTMLREDDRLFILVRFQKNDDNNNNNVNSFSESGSS
ncbi:hypothetical protein DICPUDRAFT_98532 [Dictyostelium purpureum]|uniref:RCK N-terminal domain-containing protein n=1 Tax=Dictyostelium purpureum TaxID=5786 RepID=F0ZR89_DICPU|nr:uncharacterized protein DICPUDRAFT_98532 [Dictyostelium purpureum]EGC33544.1 hypothetical protein DICPUDRAFT_98532 [Dictyostelium purpureum]|eukprot:XP_003289926.1 hypothetical protein DICPUDRAFT_98532 [Dictyostelium purpureum]